MSNSEEDCKGIEAEETKETNIDYKKNNSVHKPVPQNKTSTSEFNKKKEINDESTTLEKIKENEIS